MNVIIFNKNHPTSISLQLSRVGASVASSQNNLNLFFLKYKLVTFIQQ